MWSQSSPWREAVAEGGARPLVLAHRGACRLETENTLGAFRRAMSEGADGVELDVQCCASGEVVVFHDDDLARLAGRSQRIADLGLAALREVRLTGGGEIPTLDEALQACGPSARVNVELKCAGLRTASYRALVSGVAAAVDRAGAAERVLVSSFSLTALWLWARKRPDVPCGLLFERPRPLRFPWPLRTDRVVPFIGASAVHPEDSLCCPEALAGWRRRGLAVNVWTVDEPSRIRSLAAMGVSAIITNEPGRAASVLATCSPR
jgi:glycerophosphoryl diester phosphodiesterase